MILKNGTSFLLVIVSFCFVSIEVSGQWYRDDEGCRTPDHEEGTCISIKDCKPVMDLLRSAPIPLTPETAKKIQKYQCGFEGDQVKVCCPSTPITNVNNNAFIAPPDVSKHENLNLLPKDCGYLGTDNKIVNGEKTNLFEFPWMALLSFYTRKGAQFMCGGTIINNRYILTAAHCVTNLINPIMFVRIGEHTIPTIRDCEIRDGERICAPPVQNYFIEELIPHPEYSSHRKAHDIGLLRVARPMNLTIESSRPVCLPLGNTRNYNLDNTNVIITGWGATETGQPSPDLLKINVKTITNEACRKIISKQSVIEITERHLCAGGSGKRDSCNGDSGGPLHVPAFLYNELRYIQHGIVSFGPKICGWEGIPGVYTRVAYYMDWILDNIKP